MRGPADGITFGAADRFAGVMDALVYGGPPDRRIAAQRAETQRRASEGCEEEIGEFVGAMVGVGKVLHLVGWLTKAIGLMKSGSRGWKVARWTANYVARPLAAVGVLAGIKSDDANADKSESRRASGRPDRQSHATEPRPVGGQGRLRAETLPATATAVRQQPIHRNVTPQKTRAESPSPNI
jgi:hypothetical protein